MYWTNYHSHCTFCDGRSTMEEFVKFAIAKGIKSYGFSSHAPLPFYTYWTMNFDDFKDYKSEFERLKGVYGAEIDLKFGLEVDFINNCSSAQSQFFKENQFDYLIGSIHYVDQLPNGDYWCVDGEFDEFEAGLKLLYNGDIHYAAQRFFEMTNKMIELGGFDIVGHLDKIAFNGARCSKFNGKDKNYVNQVGETLQLIKDKGLILEINTKSLSRIGVTYPHQNYFPIINELQIPIIVNSDCHYPTNVIDGFEQIFKVLSESGFKTVMQLIDKKWQAVEFNEFGLK